jgi:subtilisin family serine protease
MRMFARKTLFHALTLVALASWGCSSTPDDPDVGTPSQPQQVDRPQTATNPPVNTLQWDPDTVIVRFKKFDAKAVRSAALSVKLEKGASVDKAIETLSKDPSIAYAQKNFVHHISAIPNDARFGDLYGLHNVGQGGGVADADIDAVEAWDNAIGSSNVVVAVVDTGNDYTHPDLAANVWTNPGEIAGNGIDDDANGVIDDVHGFNAITGSGDPMDDNAHGTHCAGTIGGVSSSSRAAAAVPPPTPSRRSTTRS